MFKSIDCFALAKRVFNSHNNSRIKFNKIIERPHPEDSIFVPIFSSRMHIFWLVTYFCTNCAPPSLAKLNTHSITAKRLFYLESYNYYVRTWFSELTVKTRFCLFWRRLIEFFEPNGRRTFHKSLDNPVTIDFLVDIIFGNFVVYQR